MALMPASVWEITFREPHPHAEDWEGMVGAMPVLAHVDVELPGVITLNGWAIRDRDGEPFLAPPSSDPRGFKEAQDGGREWHSDTPVVWTGDENGYLTRGRPAVIGPALARSILEHFGLWRKKQAA